MLIWQFFIYHFALLKDISCLYILVMKSKKNPLNKRNINLKEDINTKYWFITTNTIIMVKSEISGIKVMIIAI